MTDAAPATPALPLRVLLVDPDDRVRESLAGLLRIGDRCLVVGTAGRPEIALELAAEHAPDVVVVDPRLPGLETVETFIERLRELVPGVRVLVLSWSGTAGAQLPTGGADAYIRKTFRPHELIDAVVSTASRSVA